MNGAGLISWTEFLAATIEAIGTVGEQEFAECFHRLDCDNSGYISTGVSSSLPGDAVCCSIFNMPLMYCCLASGSARNTWRFAI
jgi:hypothetical protein